MSDSGANPRQGGEGSQVNSYGGIGFQGGRHVHNYGGGYPAGTAAEMSRGATRRGVRAGLPVVQWSPAELGVHASIVVDAETSMTPYLVRAHDNQLRAHLARARDSGRSNLVVVVGTSCTGKTRTLYEAVLDLLPDWTLAFPRTDSELTGLLLEGAPAGTVVWLDELQDQLTKTSDGILAAQAMLELLNEEGLGPILFAGTIWPTNLAALMARPTPAEATAGAGKIPALLAAATLLEVPETFTDVPDDDQSDPRIALAIATAAVTEFPEPGKKVIQVLAGGDQLIHRLRTPVGQASDGFSPAARAVINAAADLLRVGLPNPVPRWAIEGAAPGYLIPPNYQPADSWLEAALAEATSSARLDDPLTGNRSLDVHRHGVPALTPHWTNAKGTPTEAYALHDYLHQDHLIRHRYTATTQALWGTVTSGQLESTTAWRLAQNARNRGLLSDAISLFRKCVEAGNLPYAHDRLAELLLVVGDESALAELRKRASAGDGYARGRLADHLIEVGNAAAAAELLERADSGDHIAHRRMGRMLARASDDSVLSLLRTRAREGDVQAAKWLVRTLAIRADDRSLAELSERAGNGDALAAKLLWRARTVRPGDSSRRKARGLSSLSRNAAELKLLRARADDGVREAQVKLADLLAHLGDDAALDELRARADRDDRYAKRRLPKALVARADSAALDELRARSEAGDRHAQEELAGHLCSVNDDSSLDELRMRVRAGYGGMFLLSAFRAREPLRFIKQLDCEARPVFGEFPRAKLAGEANP